MEPKKPARELWSNEDTPAPEVTMEEIITRADRLRRKVRFSNTAEVAAGVFVLVMFIGMAAVPGVGGLPALSRVGAALIACATIFVLTYLLLRGAPPEGRSDRSTLACYRDDLERRRRLLASVVRWYLAPFWPGTAFFFAGILVAQREKPGAIAVVACSALFAVAINVVIAWINHRSAQRLASELASLPRPENE